MSRSKRRTHRARTTAALTVAACLTLAACGGDDGGADASGSEGGGGGGGSVTLTAAEFAFDPSDLSAASGDTIEFTNEDDAKHTFTVSDLDIDEEVGPKASTSISLGDAEAGTYDFVCTFHPDMKGTLEVTG